MERRNFAPANEAEASRAAPEGINAGRGRKVQKNGEKVCRNEKECLTLQRFSGRLAGRPFGARIGP